MSPLAKYKSLAERWIEQAAEWDRQETLAHIAAVTKACVPVNAVVEGEEDWNRAALLRLANGRVQNGCV